MLNESQINIKPTFPVFPEKREKQKFTLYSKLFKNLSYSITQLLGHYYLVNQLVIQLQ